MKLSFLLIPLLLVMFLPIVPARSTDLTPVTITSIQADFTQEKHLRILKRPLTSTGAFIFAAPQSLRWEYRSPIPSILLMHDGTIQKFIQKDGRFVADTSMRLDAMQLVLREIGNWLDGRFRENDMFHVSFPDDQTVFLLPKEATAASLIQRIELRLADQRGLLDSVTIVEGPESSTTMTFHNRVLNQDVPASVFSVQ